MVAVRTFIDLAPEMLHREQADLEELRHPEFWTSFYRKVQHKVKFIVDLLDGLDQVADSAHLSNEARVRLHEVIAECWNDHRGAFTDAGLNVEFQIPQNLPEMVVDHPKFTRLIHLLFRDALINLTSGNTLSIEAASVANEGPDENVVIRVSDNGPGLPADAVASVFDPFFLRADKPQEFGINLMACYFIVYHHGGRIDVDSRPDQGLTMNIHLPLAPKPLAAENDSEEFLSKVMINDRLWERLLSSN